jgi:pimeloyl-ACP methyl ester carboxylesterase
VTQFELDGRPIRYPVVGTGSDVVLLHGLAGSWRWWSPLVDTLAPHCRVHLLGLPRLGRMRAGEMAAWLERVLAAAGLGRVCLVGHSLGGLVAAELAASEPGRVRGLALVAPVGIPCGRGVLRRSLPLLEELYVVRGQLPTIVADAVRAGPVSLVHGIVYVWERDLRADLGSVRSPTLLVWGERDRLVPMRMAEEWQRLLPVSRLVCLPCGHVPMWEVPRELAACILGFLAEELRDDAPDESGLRVVNGVGLSANDDKTAPR